MIVEDDNGRDINLHHPDRDRPDECVHCERLRDRADRALTAISSGGYARLEPERDIQIQDLLTDLRHLFDQEHEAPGSWEALVARADGNYHAEVAGEDDDDKTCKGPRGMQEG